MPRTNFVQHIKNLGPFVDGDLLAGEWGLDVINDRWYYSRDGTTVQPLEVGTEPGTGGAESLNDLSDVNITSPAASNLLSFDAGTGRWLNRTMVQLGLLLANQKGAADGLATLGSDSKVPRSQLPAYTLTSVTTVASDAGQLALDNQGGDIVIRSDSGVTYVHNGGTAGTMADYTVLPANDTAIDGAHITSGNIPAARMAAFVVAALNAAPNGTLDGGNLTIDCGTL